MAIVVLPGPLPDQSAIPVVERPYQAHGAAAKLLRCYDPEVLLSGPAGTGKSRAALELIHALCDVNPGVRALIVRKTRESLTEAALVTFEEKVVPPGHPALNGASRRLRQSYDYPNGSTIVIGGMDKASKVMSTEYDLIYVQEAIELTENDWESLTTRLRNNVLKHRQQLIADTNPDKPTHWLKLRCDRGATTLIECRHTDNPTLFDPEKQTWTPNGVIYLAKLDALTGPRRDRLAKGKWVQAEGIVYTEWDASVHLIDRFDIPASWRRILAVDFGYTNPFVAQWWAIDPDDRMYLYRELYHTRRLVEDHAKQIAELEAADNAPISALVGDHDAEGRATLERHLGRSIHAANKAVQEGIQAVSTRLKVAGDGKPRLFVLRDSLVERDSALVEAGKPLGFAAEIDGYIWDKATTRTHGEEPVKLDDHAMDCGRYAVRFVDAGAGQWELAGSDTKESIAAAPPAGVFRPSQQERTRDEPDSELAGIMTMRF